MILLASLRHPREKNIQQKKNTYTGNEIQRVVFPECDFHRMYKCMFNLEFVRFLVVTKNNILRKSFAYKD